MQDKEERESGEIRYLVTLSLKRGEVPLGSPHQKILSYGSRSRLAFESWVFATMLAVLRQGTLFFFFGDSLEGTISVEEVVGVAWPSAAGEAGHSSPPPTNDIVGRGKGTDAVAISSTSSLLSSGASWLVFPSPSNTSKCLLQISVKVS